MGGVRTAFYNAHGNLFFKIVQGKMLGKATLEVEDSTCFVRNPGSEKYLLSRWRSRLPHCRRVSVLFAVRKKAGANKKNENGQMLKSRKKSKNTKTGGVNDFQTSAIFPKATKKAGSRPVIAVVVAPQRWREAFVAPPDAVHDEHPGAAEQHREPLADQPLLRPTPGPYGLLPDRETGGLALFGEWEKIKKRGAIMRIWGICG